MVEFSSVEEERRLIIDHAMVWSEGDEEYAEYFWGVWCETDPREREGLNHPSEYARWERTYDEDE